MKFRKLFSGYTFPFVLACLAFLSLDSIASATKTLVPGHYVFAGGSTFQNAKITDYLNASSSSGGVVFRGVQQVYYWKDLETAENQYDFSRIDSDIQTINDLGRGQKLVIQFSYKSFNSGQWEFPNYIHDNPDGIYGDPAAGGTGNGYYVTNTSSHYPYIWNSAVQARMAALFQQLASHYDSNATVQCVNLSESANGGASVDNGTYGDAITTIFLGLKDNFPQTYVIQFVNVPANQMTKWADACIAHGVGWGGPDVRPTDVIDNPGLENVLVGTNASPGAYAFYWNYWNYSSVASHVIGDHCVKGSAIQSPDYDFTAGFDQNYANATEAMHLNYLFWNYSVPHESDIINYVAGKVNSYGEAGGLNTKTPTTSATAAKHGFLFR